MDITNFDDLKDLYASLPDGTTANVTPDDLETGNFEEAHFESGENTLDIRYSGPVQEK